MAGRRLHADEVAVDDGLVAALVASQLPHWAHLPLARVASTGTDHAIFRLGDGLGLRLPRIGWAVSQVAAEHQWLPRLAPDLPAAVPEPVAVGTPGHGYPFPWLVYRWVAGADLLGAPVADWDGLARRLAAFVTALHRVDPTAGPPAGTRGGPLAPHDDATRRAIRRLAGLIDADRALAVWEAGLAARPWPGPPVWVHGDLLPGNVLVRDGTLAGVVDWGAAGLGDPACDAMVAWSMPAEARAVFRAAAGVDAGTWARARGWTVQQAVVFIPYYAETIPDGVAAARRRLEAVLSAP